MPGAVALVGGASFAGYSYAQGADILKTVCPDGVDDCSDMPFPEDDYDTNSVDYRRYRTWYLAGTLTAAAGVALVGASFVGLARKDVRVRPEVTAGGAGVRVTVEPGAVPRHLDL